MKYIFSSISILIMLSVSSGLAIAQAEKNDALFSQMVAKSGCCKVRKSPQHPWAKTGQSFDQCENINSGDGDKIYKSSGLYWWDRSC